MIIGRCLRSFDSILFEQRDKSSPINSIHYVMLYPRNGDRFATIDSVTYGHFTLCIGRIERCRVRHGIVLR